MATAESKQLLAGSRALTSIRSSWGRAASCRWPGLQVERAPPEPEHRKGVASGNRSAVLPTCGLHILSPGSKDQTLSGSA